MTESTHIRVRRGTAARLEALRQRLEAAYRRGTTTQLAGGTESLTADGLVSHLIDHYEAHLGRASAARRRAAEAKKGS